MDLRTEIQKQTEFTLDLYRQLSEAKPASNVAVSPISVSLTLAMVAAGAAGATLEQFYSSLKLPTGDFLHDFAFEVKSYILADASSVGGPSLKIANAVWVDRTMTVKPSFLHTLKQKHHSDALSVDFCNQAEDARKEVNSWAEEQTQGKIKDLLPPGSVNSLSRVVLANAIYFKGTWQQQFLPSLTADGTFYLLDGTSVTVPMMSSPKAQFTSHQKDLSYKVLRLPYVRGSDARSFSMYFLLPDERNGLPDLEKKLNPWFLQRDLNGLTQQSTTEFKLPRFRISSESKVPDVLKTMGLVLPFSEDADFSQLVDDPVVLSNVFHKAFVEVNEEGTEAAAATAATMMLRGLPQPQSFVADHPFLFLIKEDQTDVFLFIGKVLDPSLVA